MDEHLHRILSGIEILPTDPASSQASGDQWLLSSAMQKAIRRGEVNRALAAGRGLWQQDRRSFWRRLHVIALEDIGVGDLDVVTKVLAAHEASTWRKAKGDLQVGMSLIKLMCSATKSRLADELYIGIEKLDDYAELRADLGKLNDDNLAQTVVSPGLPLHHRALALWLLAGTRRLKSESLPQRKGSPELIAEVLHKLGAGADLTSACMAVMLRTQWPLALLTPLLASAVKDMPRPLYVWFDAIPAADEVEGVPFYALDMFTRTGQSCFRQFQKAVPELHSFDVRQIGLAVFHDEGGRVDQALTGEELEHYKRMGEIADFQAVGLCPPEMLGLRDIVARNASILNEIRRSQLTRYFEGDQLEMKWG